MITRFCTNAFKLSMKGPKLNPPNLSPPNYRLQFSHDKLLSDIKNLRKLRMRNVIWEYRHVTQLFVLKLRMKLKHGKFQWVKFNKGNLVCLTLYYYLIIRWNWKIFWKLIDTINLYLAHSFIPPPLQKGEGRLF